MDYEDEAPRVKRFKVRELPCNVSMNMSSQGRQYQSHKESLKDVHLPSALAQTKFDQDVAVSLLHVGLTVD